MYYLYKDMFCKFSDYKTTMQVQYRNSVHMYYVPRPCTKPLRPQFSNIWVAVSCSNISRPHKCVSSRSYRDVMSSAAILWPQAGSNGVTEPLPPHFCG